MVAAAALAAAALSAGRGHTAGGSPQQPRAASTLPPGAAAREQRLASLAAELTGLQTRSEHLLALVASAQSRSSQPAAPEAASTAATSSARTPAAAAAARTLERGLLTQWPQPHTAAAPIPADPDDGEFSFWLSPPLHSPAGPAATAQQPLPQQHSGAREPAVPEAPKPSDGLRTPDARNHDDRPSPVEEAATLGAQAAAARRAAAAAAQQPAPPAAQPPWRPTGTAGATPTPAKPKQLGAVAAAAARLSSPSATPAGAAAGPAGSKGPAASSIAPGQVPQGQLSQGQVEQGQVRQGQPGSKAAAGVSSARASFAGTISLTPAKRRVALQASTLPAAAARAAARTGTASAPVPAGSVALTPAKSANGRPKSTQTPAAAAPRRPVQASSAAPAAAATSPPAVQASARRVAGGSAPDTVSPTRYWPAVPADRLDQEDAIEVRLVNHGFKFYGKAAAGGPPAVVASGTGSASPSLREAPGVVAGNAAPSSMVKAGATTADQAGATAQAPPPPPPPSPHKYDMVETALEELVHLPEDLASGKWAARQPRDPLLQAATGFAGFIQRVRRAVGPLLSGKKTNSSSSSSSNGNDGNSTSTASSGAVASEERSSNVQRSTPPQAPPAPQRQPAPDVASAPAPASPDPWLGRILNAAIAPSHQGPGDYASSHAVAQQLVDRSVNARQPSVGADPPQPLTDTKVPAGSMQAAEAPPAAGGASAAD